MIYCNISLQKKKQRHVVTCRKGMMPSRAIAWRILGAPARLCSPAPQQEKNEPMTITQWDGQASVPTTKVLSLTDSPNLLQKQACTTPEAGGAQANNVTVGLIYADLATYFHRCYETALTCLVTPLLQYMLQITPHRKCLFIIIKDFICL